MSHGIHIDGSQGEGGGQILRSSLALALVTQRPLVIDRIRAGREKPGLARQHLTAAKAAAEICGGVLKGAGVGSLCISLEPGPVRPGSYHFRISTAGSATLVLQTVLPALLIAEDPSQLVLEGGTHNIFAPPFDFLARAYLPLVSRMGPRVTAKLQRHGFYPAGGGRFTVEIEPAPQLAGFNLLERGEPLSRQVRAIVGNLPDHIAEREVATALRKLGWNRDQGQTERVESSGPGNVVLIEIRSEHVTEVFTAFGRLGKKGEDVAAEAAAEAADYLATDAPVGPHLADQLMLPLGISAWQPADEHPARFRRRGGSFRTLPLTEHSRTHLEILRQFLEIEPRVEPAEDEKTVTVSLECGDSSPL